MMISSLNKHQRKSILLIPSNQRSSNTQQNRNTSASSKSKSKKRNENYEDIIKAFLLQKYLALSSMNYMDEEEEHLKEKEKEEMEKRRNSSQMKSRKKFSSLISNSKMSSIIPFNILSKYSSTSFQMAEGNIKESQKNQYHIKTSSILLLPMNDPLRPKGSNHKLNSSLFSNKK